MPIMSTRCKWISFGGVSLAVIIIIVILVHFRLEDSSRRHDDANVVTIAHPLPQSSTTTTSLPVFPGLSYKIEDEECPHEGELLESETGRCFKRGSPGPCRSNMVFLEEVDKSRTGSCSCDYLGFNRTILYHEGRCYYIFTQAYCPDGHWLNITSQGEPKCEQNPCIVKHGKEGADASPWVPIKGGKCAQLGRWTEGCPPTAVVRFHRGYILPSCHSPPERNQLRLGGRAMGVKATDCPTGSHRSITGKCQPTFDFDFDY